MSGLEVQSALLTKRRQSRGMRLVIALRPHHWSKNLLVFLPVIAGHRFSLDVLSQATFAFACFCAVASSGYLSNDLLDEPADRAHPRKKDRPIASGALGRGHAGALALTLGVGGLIAAWMLAPGFFLVAGIYLCASLAYSAVLKSQPVVDVLVLAALFTLRVVGGSEATKIAPSNWLLMFSLFLFLSLAIAKRCSEVANAAESGPATLLRRGYRAADLIILSTLGAAAGYSAALVLTLYVASPEVRLLYSYPERLWFAIPFLIYWISRVLLMAARGELHEDPIVFALTDRATWIAAACAALVIIAAV